MKRGISLAPGIEISYVIRDARKWEFDPERTASKFELRTIEDCWRRLGGRRRLFLPGRSQRLENLFSLSL